MAYSGNGAGTQANPYQVTTIAQLVECFDIYNNISVAKNADIYVYCKLMNDLDFNDNPQYWDCPQGLFTANNNSYSIYNNHGIYIDGGGYGIYNMYVFNKNGIFNVGYGSAGIGNFISISNCVIEAIVIYSVSHTNLTAVHNANGGDTSTVGYNSGTRFNNCDLRIKLYRYRGEDSKSSLFHYSKLTNCIINIDVVVNIDGFTSNPNSRSAIVCSDSTTTGFYRNFYNEWNIRLILVSPITTNVKLSLFEGFSNAFSSFFIEMIAIRDNLEDKIQLAPNGSGTGYEVNLENCYIVLKNTNNTYKANLVINDRVICYGVNFYDSQLSNGYLIDNSIKSKGELLALTTAQCKNAEYLEQHGFIIAR